MGSNNNLETILNRNRANFEYNRVADEQYSNATRLGYACMGWFFSCIALMALLVVISTFFNFYLLVALGPAWPIVLTIPLMVGVYIFFYIKEVASFFEKIKHWLEKSY